MACYLCENQEKILVQETLRYPSPGRAIYRCPSCSLVYLHPRMTAEEEKAFYEKEYGNIFSSEKGTTPEALYNVRLPEAKVYKQLIQEYLNKDNDCLEIGCASGYFLSLLQGETRSVAGIESHQEFNRYCKDRGIRMLDRLEDARDGEFDRVFMFFLLEHLGDPYAFLKEVRRVTRKDGYLFIIVPNITDILASVYQIPKFLDFYYTPAHQFYYSKDTLETVLRKGGLRNVKIQPLQRYDLSNHMNWMLAGKPGGQGKYNHVFSPELLKLYASELTRQWLCDTLLATAQI